MNFFVINNFFFFFSHTTQHNIQKTTKQNNRHILNISRSNQKGGGEGRTTRTQKLLLYIITYIQQKNTAKHQMVEGLAPPTRRCTFTWDNLQEAADPISFSTHVWCKPVLEPLINLMHHCYIKVFIYLLILLLFEKMQGEKHFWMVGCIRPLTPIY